MKKFWNVSLKTMSNKTFFLSDSEEANSLAIFSPYEKGSVSIWKYIKAGGLGLIPSMGIKMTKRMADFEKFALEVKNKHSKLGCWYLYVFVTMPEFRGKGLGSKIMRPMLNFCDDERMVAYLETNKEANVGLYRHYGFDLMKEELIVKF